MTMLASALIRRPWMPALFADNLKKAVASHLSLPLLSDSVPFSPIPPPGPIEPLRRT